MEKVAGKQPKGRTFRLCFKKGATKNIKSSWLQTKNASKLILAPWAYNSNMVNPKQTIIPNTSKGPSAHKRT
jgi:hypothetical protein